MIRLLLVDGDTGRLGWVRPRLEEAGFRVVGRATNGQDAVVEAGRCRPQVALLSFHLPDFSGAEAARRIMEHHPVPIVLCLGRSDGEAAAQEARRCGATSVLPCPPPPGDPDHAGRMAELVNTLRLMHEIPVVQRRPVRSATRRTGTAGVPLLIGLAASTGGPAAVQAILQNLPADYPIPLLLVQHMSDGFSGTLVEWLDRTLPLRVVAAEDGMVPEPGTLYVAAGQRHLVVQPGPLLALEDGEPVQGHRPSATVMLQSLARALGSRAVGIVLTGMGDDGAEGLLELRRRGGATFAQDEASCVVYGMPREAVRKGAVVSSLTPAELGNALRKMAGLEGGAASPSEQKEADL